MSGSLVGFISQVGFLYRVFSSDETTTFNSPHTVSFFSDADAAGSNFHHIKGRLLDLKGAPSVKLQTMPWNTVVQRQKRRRAWNKL